MNLNQLVKAIIGILLFSVIFCASTFAKFPHFKVLAFCSQNVESQHVDFGNDAVAFFKDLSGGECFDFDVTASLDDLNDEKLKNYDAILMLNDFPHTQAQRDAFQKYMENGGGWLGFHSAGYYDGTTKWPWMLEFMGGSVFYNSNWPLIPAKLVIEDNNHLVCKALPNTFISPANEWYQWRPSPRDNKNVKVLVSLSPDNYPLGYKNIVSDGDFPVVWTNTKYRMIYINMGHGHAIFNDATQNLLIISCLRWIIASNKKGNVFEK